MSGPTASTDRTEPSAASHVPHAAVKRQRRAVAARLCAGFDGRSELSWEALAAWPRWALPADLGGPRESLDRMVLRIGAHRNAAALRACINGTVLQAASKLLGDEALVELLQTPSTDGSCATLPAADALEATWRDSGRALLLQRIDDPALRAAVMHSLKWPVHGDDPHAMPEESQP